MPPSEYAWANGERCLDPERENGLDAFRLSMTAEGRLVYPAFLFKGLRLAVWRSFCSGLLPAEKARAIVGESQWLGMLRFKCVHWHVDRGLGWGFGFESTTSVTTTTTTEEEEEEKKKKKKEEKSTTKEERRRRRMSIVVIILCCVWLLCIFIIQQQQQQ